MIQLPLGIKLRERTTFASYTPGANQQLVDALDAVAHGQPGSLIYLHGAAGTGKTHLLEAACQYAGELGQSCTYLPLDRSSELQPEIFHGLEFLDLICIDDMQELAAGRDWELAAFRLLNEARERGARIVCAAAEPPMALTLSLADLRSRLSAALVFRVQALSDEHKVDALMRRARAKGLKLNRDAAAYMLTHCARDLPSLIAFLEELERRALLERRRLSVRFIRECLAGAPLASDQR